MSLLKMDTTAEEELYLKLIIARVRSITEHADVLSIRMDLTAVHSNGCPLDFEKLAEFPMSDFAHDIAGIGAHLDRRTGELQNCFVPRCARSE